MAGWPKYRRGYMGRDYHVTGGHETEAEAAQRSENPSRIGTFFLRLLGFKGTVRRSEPPRAESPRHEHPHHVSPDSD
jgi:hypothetical protein